MSYDDDAAAEYYENPANRVLGRRWPHKVPRPRWRRALFMVDDDGREFLKDMIFLVPKRKRWTTLNQPRIHVCALYGECRYWGAAPNIAFMGGRHHLTLWLPSKRNTWRPHLTYTKHSADRGGSE